VTVVGVQLTRVDVLIPHGQFSHIIKEPRNITSYMHTVPGMEDRLNRNVMLLFVCKKVPWKCHDEFVDQERSPGLALDVVETLCACAGYRSTLQKYVT
jgi:hypothetical protein